MNIELNNLAYGNLNHDYNLLLDADNEFTKLKDSFLDFPYPAIEETKLEIEIKPENRTDIEKKRVGDTSKLRGLGWNNLVSLEEGIRKTNKWIQTL